MNYKYTVFILLIFSFVAHKVYAKESSSLAVTTPISIDDIDAFNNYSIQTKQLITAAADLTKKNLSYLYGSADPKNGGMDCSGTIYYLLNTANLTHLPRDSSGLYRWVWEKGKFHSVVSSNFSSFEFSKLAPGDLLFWTGTYAVKRDPPISHVMMYIGQTKEGKHLMFGASDGRTYQNKKMWGVSVFDFNLPSTQSSSRFIGYSCIPDITCHG